MWKGTHEHEIEPDEIFLDSRNLPDFDVHQFEGRIERPIPRSAVVLFGLAFLLVGFVFVYRLATLQIVEGAHYVERSENNRLHHAPIFAERGVITDRNGIELAWNNPGTVFPERVYADDPAFSHVLGYVSYPKRDARGFYFQEEFVGKDGIERVYDARLSGEKGIKITEVNVFNELQSENTLVQPSDGENLTLTIDARIQSALYGYIEGLADRVGFTGGAGVLMDIHTGEVLAMTSYPGYNPGIVSSGSDAAAIRQYVEGDGTPFLNRVISGLYTPGSTVKPFVGIAALDRGVIDANTEIYSSGSIEVQNPYFEDLTSVFNDWKAHGWVDLRRALAVSSNVYFYEVGGGFEDQKGVGIEHIEAYARMFGLGEETHIDLPGEVAGVIPNPQWKALHFDGDPWRVGDTYHTAIGQYGFQITPLQLVRGIAAIANDGTLVRPHIAMGDSISSESIPVERRHLEVVREGMRQAVTDGTAQGLNMSYLPVAAKTGTAEVGITKKLVNSWVTGFFPYEEPRYAFTVVMEKGPSENVIGGLYVMRQLLEWMIIETPEYIR